MNRGWLAAALLAVVGPVNAADLSLNRIMLSTGGVGYFEYEAVVDGNATLSLDVPLDQVDDILKSLVVYDDNGTTGSDSKCISRDDSLRRGNDNGDSDRGRRHTTIAIFT